ncbi:MAG: serine/threonine protein kinase [Planctomycetes bacterium]|nr:serine/threonine protein kinase [Planctomycetota bacterium]
MSQAAQPEPSPEAAEFDAFLEQYWQDVENDCVLQVAEYVRSYPLAKTMIRAEYAAMEDSRDHDASHSQIVFGADTGDQAQGAFGRFRLNRLLGRGGQGLVYLAFDESLRRPVALKILSSLIGRASPALLKRFQRESQLASSLDHPAICTVYEAGTIDETPYIAMRYVEGKTLAASLAAAHLDEGPTVILATQDADPELESAVDSEPTSGSATTPAEMRAFAGLFETMARALHYAHENGVVHRDLKPGNVMITPAGEPVILDFGLATGDADDLVTLSAEGDVLGTPAYMAPEQVRGELSRVDRRTDVHALGMMLFECTTGSRPYRGVGHQGLFDAIQRNPVPDARRLNPQLPRDLSAIIQVAMEKDPDRRFQTALDLADDLKRFLNREPVEARPAGPMLRAARWVQRNRVVSIAGTLVIAALAAGMAVSKQGMDQALRSEAATLEQKKETDRQRLQALRREAALQMRSGHYQAALSVWDDIEATRLLDGLEATDVALGRIEAHIGLLDETGTQEQLKRLDPSQLAGTFKARALLLRGDYLDASQGGGGQADITAALSTGDLSEADTAYARALLATDATTSLSQVDHALANDPGHVRARELRGLLLFLLGDSQGLSRFAAHHRFDFPGDARSLVFELYSAKLEGNTALAKTLDDQLKEALPPGPKKRVDDLARVLNGIHRAGELIPLSVFGSKTESTRAALLYQFGTAGAAAASDRLVRAGARSLGVGTLAFRDAFAQMSDLMQRLKDNSPETTEEVLTGLHAVSRTLPNPVLIMMEASAAMARRRVDQGIEAARLLLTHDLSPKQRILASGLLALGLVARLGSESPSDEETRRALAKEAMDHAEVLLGFEALSAEMHAEWTQIAAEFAGESLARRFIEAWMRRYPKDLAAKLAEAKLDLAFEAPGRAHTRLRTLLEHTPENDNEQVILDEAGRILEQAEPSRSRDD